MVIELQIMQIE